MELRDALIKRRSVYALSKESVIPDEKIEEIIQTALKHTPTPFNIQNGRAVLLTGESADWVWDTIGERLKEQAGEEAYNSSKEKLAGFKNSYATILYFIDQDPVKELQEKFPLYKDSFPSWSDMAAGILQGNVWVMLAAEGMGASLQHYQNLIAEDVRKKFDIPESWRLISQMPTGKATAEPDPKEFKPVEEMYRRF